MQLDDETVIATKTVDMGEQQAQQHHVITIKPTADDLPARRSIDNTTTEATSRTATVLDWLIGSAIRDAEHRGSQGLFTD